MQKKEGDLIYGFFREKFGSLVADELVEIYLNKMGVNNFENLPLKEQIKVGQQIIENISGKFYSTDRIENLKILYLLRFSLKKASEKVRAIIHKDCDVSIKHTKAISYADIDDRLKLIDEEKHISLIFEFNNSLEGVLVINIIKEDAIEIAKVLMLSMLGTRATNNDMDDIKVSAIQEFFNIFFPAFFEIIIEIFNEDLFYTSITLEQFKDKYFFNKKFILPPLMIEAKTKMKIHEKETLGVIYLFIKDATGRFKALMDQSNVMNDLFDRTPPKLVIKSSGNVLADVRLLFKMLNLDITHIDEILKSKFINEFNDFTALDFDHFYHKLVENHFSRSTENKKYSIKVNLQNLIPIKR